MNSLTIAIPTRARPDRLRWTVERTLAHVAHPNTRMLIAIDDDDGDTLTGIKAWGPDPRVLFSIRPREDTIAAKWNRPLTEAPADVYMQMVDYAAYVTPGFDAKILAAASAFPDGLGVVYDHMANLSFPCCQAVTAKLAAKLGHFYPEHFPYWFVDHWLDDIARMIGRFAHVDIEREVPSKPATMEMREPAFWATVYDALRALRHAAALTIIDSEDFLEPAWRKELLKRNFPLHDERSTIINNIVRRQIPATRFDTDARYQRIRDKAIDTLAALGLSIQPQRMAS